MSDFSEIQRALGRVEGKLDSLLERMDGHEKVTGERIGKVETAVDKVQARVHWYSGVAAAAGALLGFGGSHGIKM